jgi:cobalt/nickel transport system ATP-binding protein
MSGAPLVEVRGLSFRYDDGTLALDGVDFSLFRGETVALLGPNGSGKTTFAHHLNGLLRGDGYISVCGLTVEKKNLAEIRRRVGLVFQDSDEQLFMPSVIEDVAFGVLNAGSPADRALMAATAALEQTGMAHVRDKAPYHLSAGEKKRVALAGVLAMNPEILVLDEPTTFLDPPARRDLLLLLSRLGHAKILITHDTTFARQLAERAVFFEKGKIAADGPLEAIVQRFAWDAPVRGACAAS